MEKTRDRFSTREERRQAGRALRNKLGRVDQGKFDPAARKFDPVMLMNAAHEYRVPELVPLKNARMALTAFRGAAPLMAADMAALPNTGIQVQICGDAHVQNLGAFGGAGSLIFDINDFDETIPAPWEWDVKRMASSLVLAGREADNSEAQCKDAVLEFASTYREFVWRFSEISVLELARYLVMRELEVPAVRAVLKKAEHATPLDSLQKLTERTKTGYCFKKCTDPIFGVTTQHSISEGHEKAVLAALPAYIETLEPARRHFFKQYVPSCTGFRIVGTGSVGTRDYTLLMFGGALDDPLFLQLKQEVPSAYAKYLPKAHVPDHHGKRVVEGVRRMLVQSDPFLGWTSIKGLPYLVRQLRDHKGGIDTSELVGKVLVEYARVCGELLAKGHSRSGDPCLLAGYLGTSDRFDCALVDFAVDYADQTERDQNAWVKAIANGKVKALRSLKQKPGAKKSKKKSKKKGNAKT